MVQILIFFRDTETLIFPMQVSKVTCNGDVNEMAFNPRTLEPIGPWPGSGRGIGAITLSWVGPKGIVFNPVCLKLGLDFGLLKLI